MSIEINLWLQDAIEFQLKEHVSRIVTERIPKDETVDAWFNVKIHDIEHAYGFIEVGWNYQTNSRRPTTHKNGTESFTITEALKICMADGVIDQLGRKLPLLDHHKDCLHGQNEWAMCTCEELKARDIRNTKAFDRAFEDTTE